ncbi:MAG: fibrobacter succinogenes major paralogous domain-containing protein [Fibromonadaceae bacterium]|jgi:uncharacterized protein (TIGR02145 family)|nr:fibrobacter succinogenes major paralogous domain-containing protein [Fibromonadaceae bacterium]
MRLVPLFVLLFFAIAVYGEEQKRVAILNTEDNGEPSLEHTDLLYLTDKLREIALKTLPQDKYSVMNVQSIIDKMGSKENARKVCKEAQCLAEIGRKVSAAYIGQARLGRFGGNLTISMELYNSGSGTLIGSFTGKAKNVLGLETIINENAPSMFGEMPGAKEQPATTTVVPDASILKDSRDNKTYKVVKIGEQIWMAENLNYNADGSKCNDNQESNCQKYGRLYNWETAKTACPEGWHLPSNADWNVLMKFVNPRCSDNSSCKDAGTELKARKGWSKSELEARKGWSDEAPSSNGEDSYNFSALPGGRASPTSASLNRTGKIGWWWSSSDAYGDYAYSRYMSNEDNYVSYSIEKKGNLVSVRCLQGMPDTKAPTAVVSSFKDSRDKKTYKAVKIGTQTWMAENLNYNANGSKCYDNKPANCNKYGRLYNWNTAKSACPGGWHLPSFAEWEILMVTVGGGITAGIILKDKSGWNSERNGRNGENKYGFSALPGGGGNLEGGFYGIGYRSEWWSSAAFNDGSAYATFMNYDDNGANIRNNAPDKRSLHSVRCLQD